MILPNIQVSIKFWECKLSTEIDPYFQTTYSQSGLSKNVELILNMLNIRFNYIFKLYMDNIFYGALNRCQILCKCINSVDSQIKLGIIFLFNIEKTEA